MFESEDLLSINVLKVVMIEENKFLYMLRVVIFCFKSFMKFDIVFKK